MKKLFMFCVAAMSVGLLSAQQKVGSSDESSAERRAQRVELRAQRTAQYIQYVDSLVQSHSYSFIPMNFQLQPAGTIRQIVNPNFELNVYPTWYDVYLPYIKGITPPYYVVVLNYSLPDVDNYMAARTPNGWKITFSTSMFSVNTYYFELDIISSTGSATLNISTVMYNTVTYTGQIYR